MGFMDRFMEAAKEQAEKEKKKAVKRAADNAVEVPEGLSTSTVYTYDGRPLKGVRVGSTIRLVFVEGTHKMESIYTGTVAEGNVAVAYKGRLVGFISANRNSDLMASVRDNLGPLSIQAIVDGRSDGGWPEITLHYNRKWLLDHAKK